MIEIDIVKKEKKKVDGRLKTKIITFVHKFLRTSSILDPDPIISGTFALCLQ